MAKLHIKFGQNEINVEGDEPFVEKYVSKFWERLVQQPAASFATSAGPEAPAPSQSNTVGKKVISPREYFIANGSPKGKKAFLLAVAYVEKVLGHHPVEREAVKRFMSDARVPWNDANPSRASDDGLIRMLGDGKYEVSNTGETVLVEMRTQASQPAQAPQETLVGAAP